VSHHEALDEASASARMSQVLRELAETQTLVEEGWDDPRFWNSEAPRTARCQYLAVGNAINFRFWRLEDGVVVPSSGRIDGEEFRGAMYMWRRLRVALLRGEFSLDASDLARVDESTFRHAFRDEVGRYPLDVAIDERVGNLRDLGQRLGHEWDGHFDRVLDASEGRLDTFTTLSQTFRAYDDPVQKLTMLNAIMLQGSGLVSFDRSPLPAIDYHLVKQAVRQGLVRPESETMRKLCAREFLTREESSALRLDVLDALVHVADRAGISTAVLDNLYWLNRRVCADAQPDCGGCAFEPGCAQLVQVGLPLENTRYY